MKKRIMLNKTIKWQQNRYILPPKVLFKKTIRIE